MKIGILGSGVVAHALAKGFLGLGDEVKLGAREAGNEKNAAFVAAHGGGKASAGTFADAAQFGEVVLLATLGTANESALAAAGPANLEGKVVIDTTNPLDHSSGAPQLAYGWNDSAGERVQKQLRGAKVVKAFNTVGNALMVNPQLAGGPPDMFLAGDDKDAKAKVAEICRRFGWGVVDVGGIASSRYLEAMCLAWVMVGVNGGGWNHAFKLLR
jgi:hypothetical protein